MLSLELKKSFLIFIRLGIGKCAYLPNDYVDWNKMKALAEEHGLSAILLDGLDKCHTDPSTGTGTNTNRPYSYSSLSFEMILEWIGKVLQDYERRYEKYKRAIADLAVWHNAHGYKMMVLKGYGCSLNWPKPEHRPCGDIDIWQFGKQKEADEVLFREKGIKIDSSHHHHTEFEWKGFFVENHYDFLNVHHHKSNVELEVILKELGQDDSHYIELYGERVYLPSTNLHALFLLRHSMSNFASADFQLRQLLDWGFFVERHGNEIDWPWLVDTLDRFGMKQLFEIFNSICVDDLGFDAELFPTIQFFPSLKERVLNDILSPEFSEKEKGGVVSRGIYKFKRWRANEWKHELCFKESMWSAFWSGLWSHLLKPSTI